LNIKFDFYLGLTIGYFWVTLLVMFTLYFFIYQVASALEKRSQANAKKVSNLVGISSSAMTNLVINMSKDHQAPQTALTSLSSTSKKKTKNQPQSSPSSPSKRHTSVDDDAGSSIINHHNEKRQSNGLDVTNRSSSNETSGEHTPVAVVAPNITNLLALTKVGMDSSKQLDESRTLLPSTQNKNSITPATTNQKPTARGGSSSKARKALRTITVIMGAFVLCWTPVSIIFVLNDDDHKDSSVSGR
jgi:muscarinic acetylcholine receptor M3